MLYYPRMDASMKEFWNHLKFTWEYAKEYKGKIYAFTLCNLLQVVISVVLPIVSAKISGVFIQRLSSDASKNAKIINVLNYEL